MFKQVLKVIWEKIAKTGVITLKDKFIIWANHLGFFGLTFGGLAVYFWIRRVIGGDDSSFLIASNWTYFCVFATLFAQKSWGGIELIWKSQWNKLFPKGLVIPYVGTVK